MQPGTGSERVTLPDYIYIGKITRPHGVKGAVRVEPLTDDPQRFKLLNRVFINPGNDSRTEYTPTHVQIGNGYIILQFEEVTSRDVAEMLRNCYIEIPRQECIPLPNGRYYYFELIGLNVQTNQNVPVGQIFDIETFPAGDMFVIRNQQKEIMIPVVKEFIDKIDLETGILTINPVEGLLD